MVLIFFYMQHNRKCILEEVVQSRIIVSCDVIANWKDPVSLSKKEIGKEFGWLYYFVLSASPLFSAWSISNKNCYRFQSTVSFGIYFSNVFWSSNRRLAIPSFYDGSIFTVLQSFSRKRGNEERNCTFQFGDSKLKLTWQGSIHWVWQSGNRQNEFVVPKLLRQIVSMFSEEMAISSDHFLRTRYFCTQHRQTYSVEQVERRKLYIHFLFR